MKLNFAVLSVLIVTSCAALAQDFAGGELAFTSTQNNDNSLYDSLSASGSIEYTFGNAFAVQIDVHGLQYSTPNDTYPSFELHGNYTLANGLKLGAFIGQTNWPNTTDRYYGLEAAFAGERWEGEAFFSNVDAGNSSHARYYFGVGGRYDITDQFSIIGGLTRRSLPAVVFLSTQDFANLGLEYQARSGLYVEARYVFGLFGLEVNRSVISVGYRFGGGTTFGMRNEVSLYPGE